MVAIDRELSSLPVLDSASPHAPAVRRCSICGVKDPNFAKRDNGRGLHSWCVSCKALFDRDIERIRYERTNIRGN